ncbi:MAG: PAQR family membrane homeostasis protein TrhA [Acidimicrobiia bacterium]
MRKPDFDVHGLAKPFLRGRIHAAALVAAVPAAVALVLAAPGAGRRLAAGTYGATLISLFAASAAYHRFGGADRARAWLRRLDHSSIYLLIAGSYTPVCFLSLSGWLRPTMLVTVWAAALIGVTLKLARFDSSNWIGAVLYIAMGWAAVVTLPAMLEVVPVSTVALLVIGGVIYTAGAIVLGTHYPNPFPRVFGYHEVWHLMVVVAAAIQYVAIHDLVTRPL